MVRPYLRLSQPKPPPSVSPATPVVELIPIGTASPNAWVSGRPRRASRPARRAPCARPASTATARIGERSSISAAVADGDAGDVVPAAADRQQQAVVAREVAPPP